MRQYHDPRKRSFGTKLSEATYFHKLARHVIIGLDVVLDSYKVTLGVMPHKRQTDIPASLNPSRPLEGRSHCQATTIVSVTRGAARTLCTRRVDHSS